MRCAGVFRGHKRAENRGKIDAPGIDVAAVVFVDMEIAQAEPQARIAAAASASSICMWKVSR